MTRSRELLSLVDIADETGISYATLRNYALKYAEEIPSEGFGRNTRYPRAAVKVFQRLRRESKPGRKPASASVIAAPAPAPVKPPTGQVVPLQPVSLPASRPPEIDLSGIERELTEIRTYLGSIAKSLEQLASEPRSLALAPVAPAPVEERPQAPVPAVPTATAASTESPSPARVPLRELTERPEQPPIGGHRRLHSLPKVMGQRGKRPE